MSTRCMIFVEGNSRVKVYKHSDGYPDGVLPLLRPLLKEFKQRRGWDPEYLTAQIAYEVINELRTYYKEKELVYSFTGCGLSTEFHSDLEYVYRVNKDFTITTYETKRGFWDNPTLKNCEEYHESTKRL